MDAASDWFMADDIKTDDVCTVFTTSGSTGFSKLVVCTHECVLHQYYWPLPRDQSPTGDFVLFNIAPFGWSGGYLGLDMVQGITRVLYDTKDDLPADVTNFMLNCLQEEKITCSYIPAQYIISLSERVKHPIQTDGDLADLKSPARRFPMLDSIILGGQPITRSHVKAASLLARFVVVCYGTTECGTNTSFHVTDPNSYLDFDNGMLEKGVEVKIVKEDDEDTTLPAGKVGLILLKKQKVMKEYLSDPEATAAAFTHDGFFRTGDIGMVDERGHLIVKGRRSEAIMRGPYVLPCWLEERIRTCPCVNDVIVVGVPSRDLNEEICACVVLRPNGMTVQQVQAFTEKEFMTSDGDPMSWHPRHYLNFEVFPVTSTSKPDRNVIKQQATARLSASCE